MPVEPDREYTYCTNMQVIQMAKVIKVGNSHAICLPVPVMLALGVERGDVMVFALYDEGVLTARKLSPEELERMKPLPVIKH